MRTLRARKVIAVVVALGVGLVLLHGSGWNVFAQPESDALSYRKALIDTGPIVSAVQAAGTVNPMVTVVVGSQLSGQIKELRADFNSVVTKGQILALLDTEQILARREQARADLLSADAALEEQKAMGDRARANLDSARANLANARAQANRAEALLKDAERDSHLRSFAIASSLYACVPVSGYGRS